MTRGRFVAALIVLASAGPICAGGFQATHGLSSAEYQDWFARTVKSGHRVIYVNGYDNGGEARFAAVAVEDRGGPGWEGHHDMPLDRCRETLATLARKGMRPLCISGYLSGDTPLFAGIWVEDRRAPRWEAHLGLSSREYHDKVSALEKRGLRPDLISSYEDGKSSYRFAALFTEARGRDWVARHDLTEQDYQKIFDEWAPRGYRPTTATAYPTPDGLRFAVSFVRDATGWSARHAMSPDDYQAEFGRMAKDGLRPLCVTGYSAGKPADMEAFDPVMRKFMKDRNIPAGTLAVSREGKLLLSRGYGHADRAGRRPVQPDDPLRLASVTKPITAAAVRLLLREGKVSLDTPAFSLLKLTPPRGKRPDPRIHAITIGQLLEHKGGWDRDKAFDPMFRPLEVAEALGKAGPAGPEDVIRYMMGQPLQFAPGTRECYSNFGYCVLGRVIEKVSGKSYTAFVREKVLAPLGIRTIELGRSLPRDRNPHEPVYVDPGRGRNVLRPRIEETVPAPDGTFYLEAMDAHGGLIGSAPDLTRFLDAYYISGEPRKGGGQAHLFFGSLPGTHSMVMQRPNGVNVVALFNQRTDPSGLDYNKIAPMVQDVADRLTGGGVRHLAIWVKND